jgi:hypothetical protein
MKKAEETGRRRSAAPAWRQKSVGVPFGFALRVRRVHTRGQDTKVHFMPLSRERMGNLSGQN